MAQAKAKKAPAKKAPAKKAPAKKPMKQPEPGKRPRIYGMTFAGLYPAYVAKAEKKGRTKAELDRVITWLTGYTDAQLKATLSSTTDVEAFFTQAPRLHPNVDKITGVVCGVRIEDIEDPVMKKIRYLDKLVDELAQGRTLERILRT